MNLEEELAGEHSSVLNSTVGRLIRSRNVPTLRSRIRSELQGALRRPITLPLPLVRRSVVIQRTGIDAATILNHNTFSGFYSTARATSQSRLINTIYRFIPTLEAIVAPLKYLSYIDVVTNSKCIIRFLLILSLPKDNFYLINLITATSNRQRFAIAIDMFKTNLFFSFFSCEKKKSSHVRRDNFISSILFGFQVIIRWIIASKLVAKMLTVPLITLRRKSFIRNN